MKHVVLVPEESHPEYDNFLPVLFSAARGLAARIVTRVDCIAADETPIVSAACGEAEQLRIAELPQLQEGRFVLIDNAFFGDRGVRGRYFRIVAGRFQPDTLIEDEPDWQRYQQLNLPGISRWQRTPGHVLVMPHTQEFGAVVRVSPSEFLDWVYRHLPDKVDQSELKIRGRRANGPRIGPEEAIGQSRVVIGFNTELLLRALRLGVPAIGHPEGSVVYAFNRLTPRDIDNPCLFEKTVEEREHFCARLATFYQASCDELENPGFIQGLLERQLDYVRSRLCTSPPLPETPERKQSVACRQSR
ncbi:hypothetical protein HFN63_37100 [Rhizobium leguminosarum]|uniref:hypothetical protein n=1 Tax=Rhizobium leguminosarum TaxID=384 RepID=UPI001C9438D9|nr:hypothetical protein [Rhizobium leguminosarum]MBY5775520.1 hypothetical protein [Rhizobium leguminosarum]